LAGAKQSRVHGQIVRTVGCGEHVERTPVVIFLAIAVPAPIGIRIGKLPFAGAFPVARLAAIAKELAVRTRAGFNRRSVADDAESARIAKQSFCRRRQDKQGLEQLLQQVVLLGGVVDLALAQDAGDEFLRNLGVFGLLLFVLFALLPRLLQAAFDAPGLMRSGCPPKPGEKVVERSDTRRLTGFKAADNGIDRRRSQRDDSVIDTEPELGEEQHAAEHVGGIVGLAASGIGGVSRTHQGSGGGQIDRRDPEDQVAIEVLQEQHGFRGVELLAQLIAYEGQVVLVRTRNDFHTITQFSRDRQ